MHCSAECLVSKGCQRDLVAFYYAASYAEKLRCSEIYAEITPRFTLQIKLDLSLLALLLSNSLNWSLGFISKRFKSNRNQTKD